MMTFIARVQLTKGTVAMYTQLKDRLLSIGFSKTIKDRNGIKYWLPNGNYLVDTEQNISSILTAIQDIALCIDKDAQIMVHQLFDGSSAWSGLERIQ